MRTLLITAAMVALAGCETTDPDLGYSIRRAVVAQAVDMNPTYAGVPMEGTNSVRALDAHRRYLKSDVRRLGRIDGKVDVVGTVSEAGAGRVAPAAPQTGQQ